MHCEYCLTELEEIQYVCDKCDIKHFILPTLNERMEKLVIREIKAQVCLLVAFSIISYNVIKKLF